MYLEMKTTTYITDCKKILDDTKWRSDDIPSKFYPIYKNPYPARNKWEWRSLVLEGNSKIFHYILTLRCNPYRDNWQATLFSSKPTCYAICKYDYHPTHKGLHIHSVCNNIENNPDMNDWSSFPEPNNNHRRSNKNQTRDSFYLECINFFRIKETQGDLFS
jgi:hypothetical protein